MTKPTPWTYGCSYHAPSRENMRLQQRAFDWSRRIERSCDLPLKDLSPSNISNICKRQMTGFGTRIKLERYLTLMPPVATRRWNFVPQTLFTKSLMPGFADSLQKLRESSHRA